MPRIRVHQKYFNRDRIIAYCNIGSSYREITRRLDSAAISIMRVHLV